MIDADEKIYPTFFPVKRRRVQNPQTCGGLSLSQFSVLKLFLFDNNQPSKTPPSVKNVLVKACLIIFPYGLGWQHGVLYSVKRYNACVILTWAFFLQQLKPVKRCSTQHASISHHLRAFLFALRSTHQSRADGSNGPRICLRCESGKSPWIEAYGNKTSTWTKQGSSSPQAKEKISLDTILHYSAAPSQCRTGNKKITSQQLSLRTAGGTKM